MRTTGIGIGFGGFLFLFYHCWTTGGLKGGGRNHSAKLCFLTYGHTAHGSRDHSGVNTSCSWVTTHEITVELAPYFDLAPVQTIQAIHVQDAR